MVPMRAHSSSVAAPAEPSSLRGLASATFFGLLFVGLLAGCDSGGGGGSSSGDGSSSSQVITAGVISPDGGQITGTLPNGQTVVLVIPPDSVPQDVPVSISVAVPSSPSSASAALTTSAPEGLGMVVDRFIGITANSTYFAKPLTICLPYNSTQFQAGPGQILRVAAEYESGWEILRPVSLSSCTGKIAGKFGRLKNGNNPSSFVVVLVDLPRRVLSPVAGNNCCRIGNHPDNSPQLSGWWSFWQHGMGAHVNGNSGHRKSNDYRAWDIHFGDGDDTKDDPATPPPGSPKDIATRAGTPYTPGEHIDLNLPVFPVEDGYVEELYAEAPNASVDTTNSSKEGLIYSRRAICYG
ncbi:MAG: hypothetical protein HP490_00625 [Nitrospira sp.]|nr:hypothetical protein [Nitrospira sp.]